MQFMGTACRRSLFLAKGAQQWVDLLHLLLGGGGGVLHAVPIDRSLQPGGDGGKNLVFCSSRRVGGATGGDCGPKVPAAITREVGESEGITKGISNAFEGKGL